MRYKADMTAGALKVPEGRIVADLMLRAASSNEWKEAISERNVLQVRNAATATRLTRLIRERLETMGPELWRLVRDGQGNVPTHAIFVATVKHSRLLSDFLDLAVREQYRLFEPKLTNRLWDEFLEGCHERDPEMGEWHESTRKRLRSSVFQSLAQAGYIESTRSRNLQPVHIAEPVLAYLHQNNEEYVLRCIQLSP